MLPTRARVRTRAEHDIVARRGRRSARGPLVVHWLARPEVTEPARAGFVTGRRVGSAVDRNLVRRRLQHLVASRLSDLPSGTLLVVRALPGSADSDNEQLTASLDAALIAASAAKPRARRSSPPAATSSPVEPSRS
jgi:ribonuclease P protein component